MMTNKDHADNLASNMLKFAIEAKMLLQAMRNLLKEYKTTTTFEPSGLVSRNNVPIDEMNAQELIRCCNIIGRIRVGEQHRDLLEEKDVNQTSK